METLLNNDFTSHYGLPVSTTLISLDTTETYFEIEDDEQKETQLHTIARSGMAAYKNPNKYKVVILNYDKFMTGLSHAFQQGKGRCDLIVYTETLRYFLLNELKDRIPKPKVKTKATSQLLVSLTHLMNVPSINAFVNIYAVKRCCYFNKKTNSPPTINATSAFNRINTVALNGLQMSNPDIEAFDFQLFEYYGGHVFTMS
jgi:hypothetical protein